MRAAVPILLMVFLFLNLLSNAFEFNAYNVFYWLRPGKFSGLLVMCFTLAYCAVPQIHSNHHVASITILLAWIEFLLLIGRLPSVSVQIEMLKKVSLTFLKFGLCYSPIILAFAFSFSVLFHKEHSVSEDVYVPEEIRNIIKNTFFFIFRTFIMFSGNLEMNELSFDFTPLTSHLIFLVFVILVTLMLSNLLNGLAVSDTRSIIEDAGIVSLVVRAKLVFQIEHVVLSSPKNKCLQKIARWCCFSFGDLPLKRLCVYPSKHNMFCYTSYGKKKYVRMDSAIIKSAVLIARNDKSQS
jgi:hypothetical protein